MSNRFNKNTQVMRRPKICLPPLPLPPEDGPCSIFMTPRINVKPWTEDLIGSFKLEDLNSPIGSGVEYTIDSPTHTIEVEADVTNGGNGSITAFSFGEASPVTINAFATFESGCTAQDTVVWQFIDP